MNEMRLKMVLHLLVFLFIVVVIFYANIALADDDRAPTIMDSFDSSVVEAIAPAVNGAFHLNGKTQANLA